MHWVRGGALGLEVREGKAVIKSQRTEQRFRYRKDKTEAFLLDSG